MLEDKNIVETVRELSEIFDSVIVTQAETPRAMPAEALAEVVRRELGLPVLVEPDLEQAWMQVRQNAAATEAAVLVTGSLYLTGNVLAMVQAEAERDLEGDGYETD
jgi:dihydrofolate synthase/folylpolyglutamate synthase